MNTKLGRPQKPNSMVCKLCGSPEVSRNGMERGKQKYICRKCGYAFVNMDNLYYMHFPRDLLTYALRLLSAQGARKTRKQLTLEFGMSPSIATLCIWHRRFKDGLPSTISNCVHHWMIDAANFGVCQCGARKQFQGYFDFPLSITSPQGINPSYNSRSI